MASFEDFGTRLEQSTSESLKSSFLPLLLLSSLSSTRFFSSCRLAATDALTAAATSLSSSSLEDKADFLAQITGITEQFCLAPVLTSVVSAPMTVPDLVLPPAEKATTNPPLQNTPCWLRKATFSPGPANMTCGNNNPGQKKPG